MNTLSSKVDALKAERICMQKDPNRSDKNQIVMTGSEQMCSFCGVFLLCSGQFIYQEEASQ